MLELVENGTKTQTRRPVKFPLRYMDSNGVKQESIRFAKYQAGDRVRVCDEKGIGAGCYQTIKSVRIERLEEISEEDAVAEGFYDDGVITAYGAFICYWDEIYKGTQYDLEHCDWVWVYEFEPMEKVND